MDFMTRIRNSWPMWAVSVADLEKLMREHKETQNKIQELLAKNSTKTKELREAKNEIKRLSKIAADIENMKKERDDFKSKHETVGAENMQLQQRFDKLTADYNLNFGELEKTKSEMETMTNKYKDLDKKHTDLMSDFDTAKKTHVEFSGKHSNCEQTIGDMQEQYRKQGETLKSIQADMSLKQESLANAEKDRDEFRSKYTELMVEHGNMSRDYTNLQVSFNELEDKVSDLEGQVENYKESLQTLEEERDDYKNKNSALQKEHDKVSADHNSLKSKYKDIEGKHATITESYGKLRNEYDDYKKNTDKTVQDHTVLSEAHSKCAPQINTLTKKNEELLKQITSTQDGAFVSNQVPVIAAALKLRYEFANPHKPIKLIYGKKIWSATASVLVSMEKLWSKPINEFSVVKVEKSSPSNIITIRHKDDVEEEKGEFYESKADE